MRHQIICYIHTIMTVYTVYHLITPTSSVSCNPYFAKLFIFYWNPFHHGKFQDSCTSFFPKEYMNAIQSGLWEDDSARTGSVQTVRSIWRQVARGWQSQMVDLGSDKKIASRLLSMIKGFFFLHTHQSRTKLSSVQAQEAMPSKSSLFQWVCNV